MRVSIKKPLRPQGMSRWLRFVYWYFLLCYYVIYGPIFRYRVKHAKVEYGIGEIFYELGRSHIDEDEEEDISYSEVIPNEPPAGPVAGLIDQEDRHA